MTKQEKNIMWLEEFGMEHTYYKCNICHEVEKEYNADASMAAEFAAKDGWRATENRLYCPACASKKLVPIKNKGE